MESDLSKSGDKREKFLPQETFFFCITELTLEAANHSRDTVLINIRRRTTTVNRLELYPSASSRSLQTHTAAKSLIKKPALPSTSNYYHHVRNFQHHIHRVPGSRPP
jgi:hypothetical protein